MAKILVHQDEGKWRCKSIHIVHTPSDLKPVLNPLAMQILERLWGKEAYPLELAKELGVDEQKIYYHIRHLQKAGLIELVAKREIKGALAKYFTTVAPSAGFELPFGDEPCMGISRLESDEEGKDVLGRVFSSFIDKDGLFSGFIVVGSPDPHGPFSAHARDGHYSLYLAMTLGRFCRLPEVNFVKLDTEVRSENRLKDNLIIVGGPGVNQITADFNEHFPIYLTGEAHGKAPRAVFGFDLYSDHTKRTYRDPAIGYIIKSKNPLDNARTILLIAGLGRRGTLAAILALTKRPTSIIHKSETDEFAHVVRGVDSAGEGSIDDIEVLE